MTFRCAELEAALRGQDPQGLSAASAHALVCVACGERLRAWDELSEAARALRREWDSPGLWPRIEARLRVEAEPEAGRPRARGLARDWRAWTAAAAVVLLALGGAWMFLRTPQPPPAATDQAPGGEEDRLLTEQALDRIERAEADYVRSIEDLARLAQPRLQEATSPLLLSYRERLLLLDTAIAECRAQIERNRFNAHLRRELLSVYQEKKRTLEQLAKGEADAL